MFLFNLAFGGYCSDAVCTASGAQAGCDAAQGCISVEDCYWTTSEGAPSDQYTCCSSYGSGGVLQQYWIDSDGDTYGRKFAGWFCSNNPAASTFVTNNSDIDDNCKCSTNSDTYNASTNPIPCHDDCGLCSYDNSGNALATRNDFRLCTDGSSTNSCNDVNNVGSDGVYSDCTGVCSGGRLYTEFFANTDGDNYGGTSQGYYCLTDANISTVSSSGWIGTGGDLDDSCACDDNSSANNCKDQCGICAGTFTTTACANGSCYAASGNAMDCAGVCSSSTPANQGSTYGATAGTFGATINHYYQDYDGDNLGSEFMGLYCSASSSITTGTNGNAWVSNQTDIDDSCNCTSNSNTYNASTNPIPCHDDCGLCSYDSSGNALTTRNDYRLCTDGSTTNNCNDANNIGTDGMYSDCTGVCNGGLQYMEFFENIDGDDFGGTSQGYYCYSGTNIATIASSGWMGTGGDLDDSCACDTNSSANDCKDQCGICAGTFTTTACANGSCYAASGNAMDCAGVCSSSTPANQGSTYGATAGTFGATINHYYQDYDGDNLGSEFMGLYCSASSSITTGTNGNAWVSNQTDIDDSCNCTSNSNTYNASTNPIPCHDDCGLCSYDSSGNALTTRNDYRLCTDGSTTNNCNDANNIGTDGMYSDCTGVCNGGLQYMEFFENIDGDDFGGTSQGYYCYSGTTIATIKSSGWVGSGGDLDDSCACTTNSTANDCKDQCGICGGNFNTTVCATGECYAETGNAMDCAGVCSASTPANQGSTYGANAGTFGATYGDFYSDLDGDGYGLSYTGTYCSDNALITTGTNGNTWVSNSTDIDENCKCGATSPFGNTTADCYDDCGLCKFKSDHSGEIDSTANISAWCTAGRKLASGSTTQTWCNDFTNIGADSVWTDCAGNCWGRIQYNEKFSNKDGDRFGDESQGFFCMDTSYEVKAVNAGMDLNFPWIDVSGDLNDNCSCSTNETANDCLDECGKCNGENSKTNCIGDEWDESCDWMDCGGVCNPDSSTYGTVLGANTGSYGGLYQEYWKDCDNDGFGSGLYVGRKCTKTVEGIVSKDNPDFEGSCGLCLSLTGEVDSGYETLSECTTAGNSWTYKGTLVANNNDYNDNCFCSANDATCIDLCNQCTGDTIADEDCIEDCSGFCISDLTEGSSSCYGGSNHGDSCSTDADCPGVGNGTAIVDDCEICSGGNTAHPANIMISSCSDTLFTTQATCEAAKFTWSSTIVGLDVGCDGECNSGLIYDDCGVCGGENLKDSQGNCAYIIHPGDTDMDGAVDVEDINPIVKYWGKNLWPREARDVTWGPKEIPVNYTQGDECLAYADANGDGKINIVDVAAVYVNLSKSHAHTTVKNCEALVRENELDIYYSIYESLPPGELKNNLAESFGFEILPEDFILTPAYPNPFNPVTQLKFQVPTLADVTIYIFNLQGQLVEEKNYIQIQPGYYTYTWDATSAPSGIYLSHVYYQGKLEGTQKLVLVK